MLQSAQRWLPARKAVSASALNADDGTLLWQAQIGTRIMWGSATDGCQLYVASRKGFTDNTGVYSVGRVTGMACLFALLVIAIAFVVVPLFLVIEKQLIYGLIRLQRSYHRDFVGRQEQVPGDRQRIQRRWCRCILRPLPT
jgi:inner membrane protein involved in colicin E2 resistance